MMCLDMNIASGPDMDFVTRMRNFMSSWVIGMGAKYYLFGFAF